MELVYLLLLALKFHSRFHPAWLLALAAQPVLLLQASRSPVVLAPLLITLLLAVLFLRQAARPLPPRPGGNSKTVQWLLRLVYVSLAVTLVYTRSPLPPVVLAMLAATLMGSENARYQWRRLGLLAVNHPAWAWLLALPSFYAAQANPAWLLLPLLLRVRPARPSEKLTPGQATLLLRLPLPVANACLQSIPADLLSRWFRPDPMRLHLRDPLLETANAPAYGAALASFLNEHYQLASPIETEAQLADFCIDYPHSVAEALLHLPLENPVAVEGWTNTNLSTLRKPGKLVQLRHLLLLRRIKAAES